MLRLRAIDLELRLGGLLQLAEAARDLVRQRHPGRGRRRAKALVELGLELVDAALEAGLDLSAHLDRGGRQLVGRALDSFEDAAAKLGARRLDLVGQHRRGVAQPLGQPCLDALLSVDDRGLQAVAQHRVGLAKARVQPLGELALDGLPTAPEVALDLDAERVAHLLERLLVLSAKLGSAGGELLGEDDTELLGALVEAAVKLG